MTGLEASLLLGCGHGAALAVVLQRRRRNRRANRYLAALLAAIALLLFEGYLAASGISARHPHLIGLGAWVPFVVAPLVYLYVREMTAPEPALLAPPWRHFVVTGAYVTLLAVNFFPREAAYKLRVAAGVDVPWNISAVEVVLLAYGMGYVTAALALLRRHRGHVQALYSNLAGVSLRWLLALVTLNALVWIAAIAAFVLRISGIAEALPIVPLGSTVTIFVIGYFQLAQAEIFPKPAPAPEPVPAPEPKPAYEKARLDDADAAAVEAKITGAMTGQRLYERAGLTLPELADAVGATPHEVSQVLSTRLGRNFYSFVNEHRIEHVKVGLATSDRSVLELANEAGFRSKSTFNNAFRKATGVTPREFRLRAKH